VHVEAGLLAKRHGLRQALHQPGDADLVDHLGQLAGAAVTHAGHGLRKRHGHRMHHGKRGGVATAHHCQRAIHGAGLATRHRRIDEVQAQALRHGVQLTRDFGRGGGVVGEDGTRLHACEGAVSAQHHRTQVVVIAHTGKNDLCARGRLTRRGRMAPAVLGSPFGGLAGGAVVDAHVVACTLQVAGHRAAHHTQADEGDTVRLDGLVTAVAHGVLRFFR
jgi:hypothetical protein